jgi:hypothetical protein
VLAAWWGLDEDESGLPLLTAFLPFVVAVEVLRRTRDDPLERFQPGLAWASRRLVAAGAVFGAAAFVWGLATGVVVRQAWPANVATSAVLGAGCFGIVLVVGYARRAERRR